MMYTPGTLERIAKFLEGLQSLTLEHGVEIDPGHLWVDVGDEAGLHDVGALVQDGLYGVDFG